MNEKGYPSQNRLQHLYHVILPEAARSLMGSGLSSVPGITSVVSNSLA